MLNRLYGIAANTFLETIRQPIYGVVLFITALLMMLNVALAAYTLEDDDKLLLDLGLSTLLLSGLFLACFSATGVLTREIENKTVLTVISKPVSRPVFFVGKFVGLAGAIAVAMYLSFLVFVMAIRHAVLQTSTTPFDMPVLVFGPGALLVGLGAAAFMNYVHGREFASTAIALAAPLLTVAVVLVGFFDRQWKPQAFGVGVIDKQLGTAALLVGMSVLILTSVALTASTRLGQVMTLLVCTLVLAAGSISDFVRGQFAPDAVWAAATYRVIPNFNVLYVSDALTAEVHVPAAYVWRVAAYAACVVTGILMLGIALFQRREVG